MKSNTAAIVAAVLVATLSLFINQLIRITPQKVDTMVGTLRSLKRVTREIASGELGGDDSTAQGTAVQRKPDQIIKDLQQLNDKLAVFFAAYARSGIPADDKLRPFVTVVGKASAALEAQSEGIPPEQLIRGRMLAFQSFFLAAGISPASYSADFTAAGERLLADVNFSQPDVIEIYRSLDRLRLYSDSDQLVLQKLRDFSASQSDSASAIGVYLLLANLMEESGRRELTIQTLRQGMDVYRNHQERYRLVNRLLDLKFKEYDKFDR